jgi:hypothetical protein
MKERRDMRSKFDVRKHGRALVKPALETMRNIQARAQQSIERDGPLSKAHRTNVQETIEDLINLKTELGGAITILSRLVQVQAVPATPKAQEKSTPKPVASPTPKRPVPAPVPQATKKLAAKPAPKPTATPNKAPVVQPTGASPLKHTETGFRTDANVPKRAQLAEKAPERLGNIPTRVGTPKLSPDEFRQDIKDYLAGESDSYPDITNRVQAAIIQNLLGGPTAFPERQEELREALREAREDFISRI